jgi:hypothetical protein
MLVDYARVCKADDQDTAAQVTALRQVSDAKESSRRRPPVATGTGRNFTTSALKHRLLVG